MTSLRDQEVGELIRQVLDEAFAHLVEALDLDSCEVIVEPLCSVDGLYWLFDQ